MRPEKVEKLIEKFGEHMDRDEYKEAKDSLLELESLLGEDHPDVMVMKSEYEIDAPEE